MMTLDPNETVRIHDPTPIEVYDDPPPGYHKEDWGGREVVVLD